MVLVRRLQLVDWLFLAGLFLVFLLPPTDPDLGWHLRCGQEIWQRYGFCSINHFSVLLEGYRWPNHHWLYQAAVWGAWSVWGLWGLTVFGAVVMGLAFWFFYLAAPNFRLEKIGLIGLISLICWGVFSFGIRSQLLAFLYFNILLWIFSRLKQKPRLVWLLPIVMLAWANTHGGSVALGLGLIGGMGVMGVMRERREERKRRWWVVLAAAVGITMVNPFGYQIYQEAWRHFGLLTGKVDLSRLIAEWVPPNPGIWWLVVVSALGIFGYLLSKGQRAKNGSHWLEALLVLVFAFLALKARRHIPFYLAVAGWLWLKRRGVKGIKERGEIRESLNLLAALLFLFYGLFIRLPLTYKANSSWESWCQQLPVGCPQGAVDFLQTQKQGNVFNRYEWGGFLIWQLPHFKIFVDGRMPAWLAEGKSPYTIYLETLQVQPGWQETLAEYNIDWIFISPGTFMDLKLQSSPESFGWGEAYRDKIAVIYHRLLR